VKPVSHPFRLGTGSLDKHQGFLSKMGMDSLHWFQEKIYGLPFIPTGQDIWDTIALVQAFDMIHDFTVEVSQHSFIDCYDFCYHWLDASHFHTLVGAHAHPPT
jgi:hypothetical protein